MPANWTIFSSIALPVQISMLYRINNVLFGPFFIGGLRVLEQYHEENEAWMGVQWTWQNQFQQHLSTICMVEKMNIFLLCISKNCAQVFWIETFCRYATLKILVFYFRWCSLTYQKYSCSDQLRSVAFFITEYTM